MTTTVNTISKKLTNYNGSYIAYFGLLNKFYEQLNQYSHMFKWYQKIWMYISIHLQILFKPMLWVFHSYTTYKADICSTNGRFTDIKNYKKVKTFYFLRIIPIWWYSSIKPNKKDIEIINE